MNEISVEIDKDVYLPCYHHLLEPNDIDIEILWGGRDSGKSKFVAQYTTELSMALDYFRCPLIKQTHESIKDSQWQMLKDTAEQWQVDHLYNFTSSPLSITCANGNSFLARGMDKPAKIRSLANPSHAWGEEFNQVSEEGFITLLTGLRSDYGPVKLFLTLNPEAETIDYEDWWFYKLFFKKHYPHELSFTDVIEMKVMHEGKEKTVRLKYRSTHVTYHDNPYITPQRIAFHESLKLTNPYFYRVFTEGLFGNKKNDTPWLFTWDRQKHVAKKELHAKRSETLYLWFDFNRNPQVCTVIQWPEEKKVQIIDVIKVPNVGTEGICEIILEKYPNFLYVAGGDYSGDTTQSLFKEQITNYTVIKKMLSLTDGQIKKKPNPKLEKNQTLINTIFQFYPVEVCPVKAKPFIFDAENVKKRADGTIVKNDRNDPAQQADVLDTVRYWFNYFMGDFAEKYFENIPTDIQPPAELKWEQVATHPNVMGDAIAAILKGTPVICTKEEYQSHIRRAILEYASEAIGMNNNRKASFALNEVKRLDKHFSIIKK